MNMLTNDLDVLCCGFRPRSLARLAALAVPVVLASSTACADWGACILPGGECLNTDLWDCIGEGGAYQGDNTGCLEPTGACLVPDECGDCTTSNGSPGCSDPACSQLVCAYDTFCCSTTWDGLCADLAAGICDCSECIVLTAFGCELQGGTYQGNYTNCEPQAPTGACVIGDGVCQITTADECQGWYAGDDTVCEYGACLIYEYDCSLIDAATCAEYGAPFLPDTLCPDWTTLGSCFIDDLCSETYEAFCLVQGGTFEGPGTTCLADPPGDTNGDQFVDIDDVVNVVLDFGTDGSANNGDVDNGSGTGVPDGFVNIDDIVFVILNYGASAGP